MDLKLFGEVFVTLLVITDPPGMMPIFLALTGPLPARDRNRAAWQAVALALGVIVIFAVAGQTLLDYLHVDLPALQAAGGLLLVLVALELLTGKADDPSQQVTSNIALVPLGTPLLAGPGAIVATMLFVQRADGLTDFTAIGKVNMSDVPSACRSVYREVSSLVMMGVGVTLRRRSHFTFMLPS